MNEAPGSTFGAGLVFQARYRLDEPIAAGGMAQVWRGEDLILQRPVAIKVLHPHLAQNENVMERFKREAISAARLTHPNIVPTFDTGADHGAAYIVMGLIDGPTLSSVLSEKSFNALTVCTLGSQIADAIDYAHRQGLIHRDIKPSNVLLVDGHDRVMVADFGIARLISESMDTSLTIPGYVMGTPDYIAPEVASSDDSSASVDIYSLGILLHEMFCGHTLTDIPTQNIPQGSQPAPTLCPRLPAPLDAIVYKATQHDPNSRYKTAAEIRDELRKAEDEFRSKEPIQPVVPPDGPATEAIPKVVAPVMSRRHAAASKQKVKDATHAKMAARRLRITTLVVVIGLIVVFAALGRFLGSLSQSALKSNNTPAIAASLTDAKSFDPFSNDKTENESQTNNLIDGDLGTSWTTQTYNSRKFGNLKAGVGFSLSMSKVSRLSTLTVSSPTADWEASVYLSKNNDTPTTLTGWGIPITQISNIRAGSTTFRLDGTEGRHILVWITDLGPSNKVQIEEVSVEVR